MRDFNTWLQNFKEVIAGYKYYTDFEKIYRNVGGIKVQLLHAAGFDDGFLCYHDVFPAAGAGAVESGAVDDHENLPSEAWTVIYAVLFYCAVYDAPA